MRELSEIVKKEIREAGPISFRRFLELALFHPDCGYYFSGKAKIGKRGDFYTAPSVHSSFGETLCAFITRADSLLGERRLRVLEFGASSGRLAFDILEALRKKTPDIYDRTDYTMSEISPPAVREAKKNLEKHGDRVRWIEDLGEVEEGSFCGVVLANEFLDSFPFHRVRSSSGKIREIFLEFRDGKFREILRTPETEAVQEFADRYFREYEEGEEAEVRLLDAKWLRDVGRALRRGFVLMLDYGFLAPELYSVGRRKGTYRCFYRHELVTNPYVRVGEQDVTSDVNFSELMRVGETQGLRAVKYATQGQFLVDWGILDILERYSGPECQNDRLAIKTLLMPEFMGSRFKTLLLSKGFSEKELEGFYRDARIRITPRAL